MLVRKIFWYFVGLLIFLFTIIFIESAALVINNNELPTVYDYCSESESERFSSAFLHLGRDNSACDVSENWILALRNADFTARAMQTVILNIGFNKGYNFAEILNIFAGETKINK